MRGLDYYTGLVFRIYAPGLGFEVGGGGRYDGLLARFGRPLPAVGFMLGLMVAGFSAFAARLRRLYDEGLALIPLLTSARGRAAFAPQMRFRALTRPTAMFGRSPSNARPTAIAHWPTRMSLFAPILQRK